MTEQEIQLVVALAGLAVAITLVDLLLSMMRHRRRVAAASRALRDGASLAQENRSDPAAESMSRRLGAIEASESKPW